MGRPLHLFGTVGLIFGITGMLINAYIASLWLQTGTIQYRYPLLMLGVFLTVLGVQFICTGLLADMLTRGPQPNEKFNIRKILEINDTQKHSHHRRHGIRQALTSSMNSSNADTAYASLTTWTHRYTPTANCRITPIPMPNSSRADIRDYDALKKALRGIEIIFHKAAAVGVGQSQYEIKKYVDVNTGGHREPARHPRQQQTQHRKTHRRSLANQLRRGPLHLCRTRHTTP